MDPADGDIGTIVARTCSNLIIFPRGVFKEKSFSDFCTAVKGILDLGLFNIV